MQEAQDLDTESSLSKAVGLLTPNADFRVFDRYPVVANVHRMLNTPPMWMNDTWQIGESQPEYRYGFVNQLHKFVDFYNLGEQEANFWCFGKLQGGMSKQSEERSVTSKPNRGIKIRNETVRNALQAGVKVFFIYYNVSSGIEGSHWTLSSYVLRGNAGAPDSSVQSYYFDSMGGEPTPSILTIHNDYKELLCNEHTITPFSEDKSEDMSRNRNNWQAKQSNGNVDCGVWVCWCMLQIVLFAAFSRTANPTMNIEKFMVTRHDLLQAVVQQNFGRRGMALMERDVSKPHVDNLMFRLLFFRAPRLRVLVTLFGTEQWPVLVSDLRQISNGQTVLRAAVWDSLLKMIHADHPVLSQKNYIAFEVNHHSDVRADKQVQYEYERAFQTLRAPHQLLKDDGYSSVYCLNDFTMLAVVVSESIM